MAELAPIGISARPVLHLSGPRLRAALERLVKACEDQGGVESYAAALKMKAGAFQDLLGEGRAARLGQSEFQALCALMATVRRRIGRQLGAGAWPGMRTAIAALLEAADNARGADERVQLFLRSFPDSREHRFVRDLAAELLHNCYPEHYPLMQRWVWDSRTNTGLLREIWHGENVDHMVIDVPDGYETFLVLREELSHFLSENGVFRDVLWYVDLLAAQVYADYIAEQGGVYLRTDFGTEGDPLEHTRRILGLDGVLRRSNRARARTVDAEPRSANDTKRLS